MSRFRSNIDLHLFGGTHELSGYYRTTFTNCTSFSFHPEENEARSKLKKLNSSCTIIFS